MECSRFKLATCVTGVRGLTVFFSPYFNTAALMHGVIFLELTQKNLSMQIALGMQAAVE